MSDRNLKPHAEARLAMILWSREYAYDQTGGSMDFWESRTPTQQAMCVKIVDGILKAISENGRASAPAPAPLPTQPVDKGKEG